MTSQHAKSLPAAAVETINEHLAQQSTEALAANAQHLLRAMQAHEAAEKAGKPVPLLGLLMPNLHAVLVVLTGSHSEYGSAQQHCLLLCGTRLFL